MKHKFLSKKYWDGVSTAMSEASTLKKSENLINLSIGDIDFITHKDIIDAAKKDALTGHTKYTDACGDPQLLNEIVNFYDEEYKFKVKKSEIIATVGACHGMFLALQAILNEGDEVIVPEPYFTPYLEQVKLCGGKFVPLKVHEEDEFSIDIKKLESLINKNTRAIILNYPNNPTGAVLSRETIEGICEIAIKHDLIILSDEVYDAYVYEGDFKPVFMFPGMKERTITLQSFSKSYAMTGWRIGYTLAPDYIIDTMREINEGICFTAPSISQRAALHGMMMRNKVQPSMISAFKERISYSYERINKIKNLSVIKPKGGIYLFMNIKKTGMTSDEFSRFLMDNAEVKVLSGTAFGTSGEGYVRIACTVSIDKLKCAYDRMEKLLNKTL